jgi:hypothetical protein
MPSPPSAAPHFSFARTDYVLSTVDPTKFATPPYGVDSVAVGDLDGKNGPDIVALSSAAGVSVVYVLLNKGDGTFEAPRVFPTCAFAQDLVVGQFNPTTDSNLDVAVICAGVSTTIARMLGDGAGNLGPVQTVNVGYTAYNDGTGDPFIAIIDMLRFGAMNGPTLVYRGYISGRTPTLCFVEVIQLELILDQHAAGPPGGSTSPFCNYHFSDIPGPGFEELADWGPLSGDLVLGEYTPVRDEPFPRDEALSGGLDVSQMAVTGYESQFAPIGFAYGFRNSGSPSGATAVALADVDGDGLNDILMGGDGTIAMYVPGFPIEQAATPTRSFASLPGIVKMVTADFDLDGNIDIAVLGDVDPGSGDSSDASVGIHAGNGDGTFATHEAFTAKGSLAQGKQQMIVADFNRDGKPDVVTVGGFYSANVSVLLNTTTAAPTGLPPTISSFGPTSGVPGTIVTIHGTRLYKASSVKFGGEQALIVSNTPTVLKVRVPSGALSGTIAVTTQGGTATSAASFTAIPAAVPIVTGFSPTSGVVGTTVTIHGSGLQLPTVKFGGFFGVVAPVLSDTATTVKVLVPAGAPSGPIKVDTARGTATSVASFTVNPSPVPVVSGFSPASGVPGTLVSIPGSGLLGASGVTFGGVATPIVLNTATKVTARVPAGAASGKIAVTTPGGTATSVASFTVNPSPVPTIASFSPISGVWGTTVTIQGSGLLGTSSVKFNGVTAPIVSNTATVVKALAPVGSTPGTIAVTTPGGTATSAGTFTPN